MLIKRFCRVLDDVLSAVFVTSFRIQNKSVDIEIGVKLNMTNGLGWRANETYIWMDWLSHAESNVIDQFLRIHTQRFTKSRCIQTVFGHFVTIEKGPNCNQRVRIKRCIKTQFCRTSRALMPHQVYPKSPAANTTQPVLTRHHCLTTMRKWNACVKQKIILVPKCSWNSRFK